MILRRFSVGGIIPFPEPVTLEVDALPRGVIGVRGENGEGKTSLLETGIVGSVYRTCPTRGPLLGLGVRRDAFASSVWDLDGEEVYLQQTFDHTTRDSESVVTSGPLATPLIEQGKVSEFDAWRDRDPRIPPLGQFLATQFIPQKRAGFMDLSTTERKALVLRFLGIEHLEDLARRAALALSTAQLEIERVQDSLKAWGAMTTLEAAQTRLAAARETASRLEEVATRAVGEVETARAIAAAASEAYRNADAARKKRAPLLVRRRAAVDAVQRHVERTLSVVAIIDAWELEGLGDVVAALAERDRALVQISEKVAAILALRDKATSGKDAKGREAQTAARAASAAALRARDREKLEAELNVAREADELLGQLRADVKAAEVELTKAQDEVHAIRLERLEGKDRRIGALRGTLEEIGEQPLETPMTEIATAAASGLAADDEARRAEATIPEREKVGDAAVKVAREKLEETRGILRGAEARVAAIPATEERLMAAQKAREEEIEALEEQERARLDAERFAGAIRGYADDLAQIEGERERLRKERDESARHVERSKTVSQARGLLPELELTESFILEAERLAAADLALAPEPSADAPPPADLSAEEQRLRDAQERATAAQKAVGAAEAVLEQAQTTAAAIARDELRLAELRESEADLTLIRDALGRNGIQALEIDAAGPELSALANSYLHECYGTRWTVTLVTVKTNASGGESEVFDVNVLDTRPDRNREDAVKWKSGGEGVIIGEAITMALATFAASRARSQPGATWVRDESGAALDGPKAKAYVAMLRRAAELGGAARVLLVTHSADVLALCDAIVTVDRGTVSIA